MANGAKFRKIVVAYDGSKDSARAVQTAALLAAKFSSDLVVVHVYSSPMLASTSAGGMLIPNYSELEDAAKLSGRETLTRGVRAASAIGARARGELLEASSTVEALVDFALNEKADLIVVGTRGMTGFKKLLMGSVSSGLVSHAPCPVLVVR
jgi:nucleotide-binding universal stress UspA family protein